VLLTSAGLVLFVGPGGFAASRLSQVVVFRLPRLGLGILAGGVLATVGASLQGLLRNPLVDPFTLGVASGAALGSTIVLVIGRGSSLFMPLGAFAGALGTIVVVFLLARIRGRVTKTGLVLAGVIVSFFFSSLLMLVMILGHRSLGEAVYLVMGHLGVVLTRESAWVLAGTGAVALLGCLLLFSYARVLDIMSLSDEAAACLGVDVPKVTKTIFLVASLVVGLVVAWTGAISFVGLVVPHLVRLLFGPRHQQVLPGSFVLGAGVLLLSDVVARNIVPGGLPLSVITALIGVPFFIYLLRVKL